MAIEIAGDFLERAALAQPIDMGELLARGLTEKNERGLLGRGRPASQMEWVRGL